MSEYHEYDLINHERKSAALEARYEAIEDDLREQHNGEEELDLYRNNKYVTCGSIDYCVQYACENDDDDYWTIQ